MSHRSEYFEIIDKYLNNELTAQELKELEQKMEYNSDLVDEFNLQFNIQQAIQEQDIVSLRENMCKITSHQPISSNEQESPVFDSFNFGLAEEITDHPNFNTPINIDNINEFTQTFPKIHLYQHLVAAKENIYQFYKEQQEQHNSKKDLDSFSQMENDLFDEVKNAMQENDLLDLRANLKQIASNVSYHTHTSKDIHNYVDDAMVGEQRIQFEELLAIDKSLANDVKLFQEVDLALSENDIMHLRASLNEIKKSTLQFSSGIKEIDGYLYNELNESEMTLFEAELANNQELYAEIDLIKNIDYALQENDVMQLRNSLRNIANDNLKEKQIERSITVSFKPRKIALSVVAASLILLIGITGLFKYTAEDDIYQKFYTRYETAGISRSSNSMSDGTFALALQKYNNQEYQSALNLLQEVISRDDKNVAGHFYSAVSLQELGKYKNALEEYQVVVVDKDNLFIEQAEWYIGLCFIQTQEDKKAIKQFKKIVNGKGFYAQKASAILRTMKNSL
ncbi:MAG TPA: hypothetical protein VGK10_10890 [Prolixibacteraceae bacterium]|jgi:hypothetical protein